MSQLNLDFPKLREYLASESFPPGYISMAVAAARHDAGLVEDTTKPRHNAASTSQSGVQTGTQGESASLWAQARAKNAKGGDTASQGGKAQASEDESDSRSMWKAARARSAA